MLIIFQELMYCVHSSVKIKYEHIIDFKKSENRIKIKTFKNLEILINNCWLKIWFPILIHKI